MMNLDQITDAPDILMEYLEYHSSVRGHSDLTVSGYYHDLKILFRFLKLRRHLVPKNTSFNEIDITDVDIDFINILNKDEVLSWNVYITWAKIPIEYYD